MVMISKSEEGDISPSPSQDTSPSPSEVVGLFESSESFVESLLRHRRARAITKLAPELATFAVDKEEKAFCEMTNEPTASLEKDRIDLTERVRNEAFHNMTNAAEASDIFKASLAKLKGRVAEMEANSEKHMSSTQDYIGLLSEDLKQNLSNVIVAVDKEFYMSKSRVDIIDARLDSNNTRFKMTHTRIDHLLRRINELERQANTTREKASMADARIRDLEEAMRQANTTRRKASMADMRIRDLEEAMSLMSEKMEKMEKLLDSHNDVSRQ